MLQIRALSHHYPGAAKPALDGVSLQAERGAILGLLGPNGAGKTTLISHLAGWLPVTQGQILVDGKPLSEVRRSRPTRIAVAPQDFAFYPLLSVRENMNCFAAAARLSGAAARSRIESCLAFAKLERFADARAGQLSGGLKRRLNFALALLPEPELVLFDEPTVGVDPQSRAFLLDAVRTLAQQGVAVVYTSHYMEEIEAIADRVLIIDHGKVLRDGTLDELLAEGETRLRFALAGIDNETVRANCAAFGKLLRMPGEHGDWLLALDAGHAPGAVLAALESAGAEVLRAEYGRSNLEQLFMQLTERSLRDD